MLLGYILGIIQDTDSLCSNSARTTCYNQEKTSPKGLVFSWLTLADTLRTACLDFDKSNLNEIKAILATTA